MGISKLAMTLQTARTIGHRGLMLPGNVPGDQASHDAKVISTHAAWCFPADGAICQLIAPRAMDDQTGMSNPTSTRLYVVVVESCCSWHTLCV